MHVNLLRRSLSAATATALLATGMALTAGPAQAVDEPAPNQIGQNLAWKVSGQFAGHLGTHVLADGATEDAAKVITFVQGSTSLGDDGVERTDYRGTVTGSFLNAGTNYYSVTIKDPVVNVAPDGSGSIEATVSASNAAANGNPAGSTEAREVVVATFSASQTSEGRYGEERTATPEWVGVLAPDSPDATALALPEGQPIDGKSFHPEFLGQLTPGLRAHFLATKATTPAPGTLDTKAPAPFMMKRVDGRQVASPVVTGTRGNYGSSAVISVRVPYGTGSVALTGAGDTRTATLNDEVARFTLPANLPVGPHTLTASYAGNSHWLAGGSTVTLTVSRTTSVTTAQFVTTPKRKKPGTLAVRVASPYGGPVVPTGRADVLVYKGKKLKKRILNRPLAGGAVNVTVPKLPKGAYTVRVSYPGDAGYSGSAAAVSFRSR